MSDPSVDASLFMPAAAVNRDKPLAMARSRAPEAGGAPQVALAPPDGADEPLFRSDVDDCARSARLRLLGRLGGGGISEDEDSGAAGGAADGADAGVALEGAIIDRPASNCLRFCEDDTLWGGGSMSLLLEADGFDPGSDDGMRRLVARLEAVATALRTANRACFIMDCRHESVSRTISDLEIRKSFAKVVVIVPGATIVTLTRFPKILRSTIASMTMGITISPLGVSSQAASVRKEVTTADGAIGLSAHANRPTRTRVKVASFCM